MKYYSFNPERKYRQQRRLLLVIQVDFARKMMYNNIGDLV